MIKRRSKDGGLSESGEVGVDMQRAERGHTPHQARFALLISEAPNLVHLFLRKSRFSRLTCPRRADTWYMIGLYEQL